MRSISLKNLRSFRDTGHVPIKDINILVGQNSSGKSSFLRTFPLLRQSIVRDTRGPILWYDDSLVDFGSYKETKHRFASDTEGIHLGFEMHLDSNITRRYYWEYVNINALDIRVDIEIHENNRETYIKNLNVFFTGQTIFISANPSGEVVHLRVNDIDYSVNEITHVFVRNIATGLIPMLIEKNKKGKHLDRDVFRNQCTSFIKKLIGNRIKKTSRIDDIIRRAEIGSKETLLKSLQRYRSIKTWQKIVSK